MLAEGGRLEGAVCNTIWLSMNFGSDHCLSGMLTLIKQSLNGIQPTQLCYVMSTIIMSLISTGPGQKTDSLNISWYIVCMLLS